MEPQNTIYVLGFAFNHDCSEVLLIEKSQPEFLAGYWNGLGGKVEKGDHSPAFAMAREFSEEATVYIKPEYWVEFGIMSGPGWRCYLFAYSTETEGETAMLKSKAIQAEEEPIKWALVEATQSIEKVYPNLRWLIPAAIDNFREPKSIYVQHSTRL